MIARREIRRSSFSAPSPVHQDLSPTHHQSSRTIGFLACCLVRTDQAAYPKVGPPLRPALNFLSRLARLLCLEVIISRRPRRESATNWHLFHPDIADAAASAMAFNCWSMRTISALISSPAALMGEHSLSTSSISRSNVSLNSLNLFTKVL